MTTLPRDISDLHLAPVLLALDARLDELGRLDAKALATRVAMEGDLPDWNRQQREAAVLRSVEHFLDTHSWQLSWDVRGIRVTHEAHSVVLGLPLNIVGYLNG